MDNQHFGIVWGFPCLLLYPLLTYIVKYGAKLDERNGSIRLSDPHAAAAVQVDHHYSLIANRIQSNHPIG